MVVFLGKLSDLSSMKIVFLGFISLTTLLDGISEVSVRHGLHGIAATTTKKVCF